MNEFDVIGFSTEQWYCNKCKMMHFAGEKTPCQEEKAEGKV